MKDRAIAARTVIAGLAGTAFAPLSCWLGAGSLFIAGMRCDEGCSDGRPPPGADWTNYSESVQWTQLGWLAGANVLLASVAASLVMGGRRRLALPFALAYCAVAVPLVVLMSEDIPFLGWLWILAAALGLTMALSARGGRRPAASSPAGMLP